MVWAVLVAAGRGERLGEDRPKAFVRLGELPLLAEPLRRLDLPPCDPDAPFNIPEDAEIYLKIPERTKSISLRVTWRDGTQSEVNTIER